ncbi:MAG: CHAT domain-containing protein, partial [Bacteroidota bacterium]|nr:CHAT domain-containing protein [Bacteroidota bacterium]
FDDENFIDKINYFIERNKTSTLLQSLKNSKTQKIANVPDSLLQRENKIRENINIFNQKISEATSKQEESFYREKLLVEQVNFKNIINYYKNNYPNYYKAKYNITPSKVSNLQRLIDEETVIINYAVAGDRLFAFVITKNHREIFVTPFNSSDKSDINDMNTALLSYKGADIKKYTQLSFRLFQKLFFFVIPDNIKNMIIIPIDIIGTVPFEALQTSEYTDDFAKIDLSKLPYLIKHYSISYSYSTTLLYETMNIDYSNSNREDIVALAPVFKPDNPQTFNYKDIETIIGSEIEIQNIIDFAHKNKLSSVILSNKEANEYKLKKLVNSNAFKIVHIATHGFVNFENPELSALILSKDGMNIEDGILYSGEIYNLKLKSELINLSACETARGKFSKGEGVIGLSRAFIYAGAKNLIISLWKVSDISTTKEMELFYKHLLNEYPNLQGNIQFSKALQQAKLDMINSKFSHPYFWSPFILIGM